MTENINPILQAALSFTAHGCSVVPTRMDESKAPFGSWKRFQTERANAMQLHQWFKDPAQTGMGIITGRVSGNLEMLEFEGRAVKQNLLEEAREIAENSGLGDIWSTLVHGYSELTPSGGIHIYYRISDAPVPGNTKLAQQPGEDGGCLIETRGEGGFSITAPSYGKVHPSGLGWTAIHGSPATIATISMEQREAIHHVLRALDQMPAVETVREVMATRADAGAGVSPGDDYSAKTSWDDLLIPRGWSKVFTSGKTTYWRRPGKSVGISATTGRNEHDNLFVFSTSTIFEAGRPYSKFAALTTLDYAGDFKACARALRSQGFGSHLSLVPDDPKEGYSPSHDLSIPEAPEIASESPSSPSESLFLTSEQVMLREEVLKGRARRAAKKVLDEEDAGARYDDFTYVETLAEELEMPMEEIPWTIKGILPKGANVTLTAQYKAGKTTLINQLTKSLVDKTPFLNYFNVPEHEGRVVIFNYEVSENQYRRWMQDVAIEHSEMVTLVHLRGKAVPLRSEYVQKQVIGILQRLHCETWIVDPFARAFTGSGDENSNSDVGVFLDLLDVIKDRASISNLILPVHTGRNAEMGVERARGATRIDDWADVRWILKKTDEGRFFSADGRDVLIEEQMLKFDEASRSLTLGGSDARSAKKQGLEELWVAAVKENPGATTGQICAIVGRTDKDKGLVDARKTAVARKLVKSIDGPGRSQLWYPINAIVPTIFTDVG